MTILDGLRMSDSPDTSISSSNVSNLNFEKNCRQRCHESLTCSETPVEESENGHWVEQKDNRSRKISSEGNVLLCY